MIQLSTERRSVVAIPWSSHWPCPPVQRTLHWKSYCMPRKPKRGMAWVIAPGPRADPGQRLALRYLGTTCIIRKDLALSVMGYGVSLFAPNHFS